MELQVVEATSLQRDTRSTYTGTLAVGNTVYVDALETSLKVLKDLGDQTFKLASPNMVAIVKLLG